MTHIQIQDLTFMPLTDLQVTRSKKVPSLFVIFGLILSSGRSFEVRIGGHQRREWVEQQQMLNRCHSWDHFHFPIEEKERKVFQK